MMYYRCYWDKREVDNKICEWDFRFIPWLLRNRGRRTTLAYMVNTGLQQNNWGSFRTTHEMRLKIIDGDPYKIR